MKIRFDYDSKFNIDKTKNRIIYYLSRFDLCDFEFYFHKFILNIVVTKKNLYESNFYIYDIERNSNNLILNKKEIIPLLDDRFNNLFIIKQNIFLNISPFKYENNLNETTDLIIEILKVVMKLSYLKDFA